MIRLTRTTVLLSLLILALLSGCVGSASRSAQSPASTTPSILPADARDTLSLAAGALAALLDGPNGQQLTQALHKATAVLIAPRFIKAGFVFGGSGGRAVLVGKNADGGWSAPSFMRLAGVSAGFQAGVSEAAFVLVALDDATRDGLLENGFTLDAELLAVALGKGREVQESSMTYDGGAAYFSSVDGLFAGVALDGTVISADKRLNELAYAPGATPRAIVTDSSHALPEPSRLADILDRAAPHSRTTQ